MLMIRLQRVGRKHNPFFRVVVTDKQNSTKSGRFLEIIGSYDARMGKREINAERAKLWLEKGAKATGTVHNMLVDKKIISGKKVGVVRFPKVEIKEEKAPESKAEEAKVVEEKVEEKAEEKVEEATEVKEEVVPAEAEVTAPTA